MIIKSVESDMHDNEGHLCQVLGQGLLHCGINVQFAVSHGYGVIIKALIEQKSAVGGHSRLER